MLSLRSLAFILCSAIRRERALSCAAVHCFPDIINGRKMATNMAAPMCSLLRTVYTFHGDHGSARKKPPLRHHFRSNGRITPISGDMLGYSVRLVGPANLSAGRLNANLVINRCPDPLFAAEIAFSHLD